MSILFSNRPARFLCTKEAARFLCLSARTLEKHRVYGTGPQYFKLGGRVVYKIEDLQTWADPGVRRSTSDPGTGLVRPAKRYFDEVEQLPSKAQNSRYRRI
jgi:hypothetical protein